MSAVPTRYSYDSTQLGFHWVMAALIFVAIVLGIISAYLPPGTSPRKELLDIHKSLGMTVLVLLPLRFFYRLLVGEPPYRASPGRLMHFASKVAHFSLYALMLLVPITGYIYSAAGNYSLPWFGLFQWPRILPLDKNISDQGYFLHTKLAWVIGALLALHVAAVIWHHFIKHDEVLLRMLPKRD
jgi:cytochrome b561